MVGPQKSQHENEGMGENFPNGEMLVARPIGFRNSWFMMKSNNLKGKAFVVCVLGFQTADRTWYFIRKRWSNDYAKVVANPITQDHFAMQQKFCFNAKFWWYT